MIFLTTGQTILAFLRNCKLYLYMRYDMYTENKRTNHPHITHCLGDKLVKIWFKTNWGLVWRMTISLQREREREWVSEWVCECVNEWVSVREREWVSECVCVCVCVCERERERGGRYFGYVAYVWDNRHAYMILVRQPEWKILLECLGIDKKMLKWIIKGQDGMIWACFIWLRVGTSGGLLWIWNWIFVFSLLVSVMPPHYWHGGRHEDSEIVLSVPTSDLVSCLLPVSSCHLLT